MSASRGAREKAYQLLREAPRVTKYNIKGLPEVPGIYGIPKKKKGFYDKGWGGSARQKLYFGPLGYEGGSTPIQRKTSFERSYNYGLRFQRQFPPISLAQLQLMIDTERLDPSQPIDMATLCGTKVAKIDPSKNHFGFHLTSEGMDNFEAKVNIEVQWADEQSIAAIEKNGGSIKTAYFDLHSVIALSDPLKFFKTGAPIPRRLTPPDSLMEYYIGAENRGYLADPQEILNQKLALAQKYGYELTKTEEGLPSKDPRQIFYGLQPGWIINLADELIYKSSDTELEEIYQT